MTREAGTAAYRALAEDLRARIASGEFPGGSQLPTEVELRARYNVSRHTVREALQQLDVDGIIDRVQGSGTYVRTRPTGSGGYVRSIGSLDDIIHWPHTNVEVLDPFRTVVDPGVARRLDLPGAEVAAARVRRLFEGQPFVMTRHFVAPGLGRQLDERGVPREGTGTVIAEAEMLLPRPVAGAQQTITAITAPSSIADVIDTEEGSAILLIERLYYDTGGAFVELTESYFNPRRYSYRADLQRRGPADAH